MPISPTLPSNGDSNWDVSLNAALTTIVGGVNTNETDIGAKLDSSAAPELIRDTMGAALVAGTNVTITVDDPGDTITIAAAVPGGSGDMAASVYDPTNVADDAFDMDNMVEGTSNKILSSAERTKLTGIATGATANSSDATLLARANHTGTQSADTLTDGTTNKAFLATERTKLSGIATGATANSSDATLLARANHTGTQTASTVSDFSSAARTAVPRESTFGRAGALVVVAGTGRLYNRSGVTRTIAKAVASVGTAPTGASAIIDVNKGGTTIFTTQSNRPTIAASGFEGVSGTPNVTSWADGEYLTVDIDQIGSTIAGSDLTVVVVYS